MSEPETPIPMKPVQLGNDEEGNDTIDNLWISMDMAVGDMGNYSQQVLKGASRKSKTPAKNAQS